MCRQVLFNKTGLDLIDNEYGGMENYLKFLVVERGGNGNGLVLVKNGKIIKFNKRLDYSVEEINDVLHNLDFDWALFHTRLATVGSLTSSNCHPFVFSLSDAVCMNGTEKKYALPRDDDRSINVTDAERVISDYYFSGKTSEEFFVNSGLNSVYLGFEKGKPFAAVNFHKNMRILTKDDAILFGSDFPTRYDGKDIYDITTDDFYWEEGRSIDASKIKPASTGRECLVEGLTKQLFNKTLDTYITILAQKMNISEEEISSTYTVGEILELADEYAVFRSDDVSLVRKRK